MMGVGGLALAPWMASGCLCAIVTAWGGALNASHKGRDVPVWTLVSLLAPPFYLFLFRKKTVHGFPIVSSAVENVAAILAGLSLPALGCVSFLVLRELVAEGYSWAPWIAGWCVCAVLSAWGGFINAARQRRDPYVWVILTLLVPPLYLWLFRQGASQGSPVRKTIIEYVALVASLLSALVFVLLIALLCLVALAGSGSSSSSGRRHHSRQYGGSSSWSDGSDNGGCCGDGDGSGDCC